jgi:hypothetical protein
MQIRVLRIIQSLKSKLLAISKKDQNIYPDFVPKQAIFDRKFHIKGVECHIFATPMFLSAHLHCIRSDEKWISFFLPARSPKTSNLYLKSGKQRILKNSIRSL